MALMEVIVSPRKEGVVSVADELVPAIEALQASGLKYEIHAMGTNVEGPVEDLLRVAGEMHAATFRSGVLRVVTSIRLDDRRDKEATLADKAAHLRTRVGDA